MIFDIIIIMPDVTIRVLAETNAGGREYMGDYIAVNLAPNDTLKEIPDMREQAYIGVFDGHGGVEAEPGQQTSALSYGTLGISPWSEVDDKFDKELEDILK